MARKGRESLRGKLSKGVKDRTKESHSRRESGGGMKNYFDEDAMNDVPTWWAAKGVHIIDIIPYLAGPNDPRTKEGDPAYVLDIEVHRAVGPMEEMIVCLEQYGKPCPVCEESRRVNRAGGDYKKEVKPLQPKRRVMYNIIVRNNAEMEKKGVQIFEIAHFFMEKHLAKIAKNPRDGGFTIFSDPDEGASISFDRTGAGKENTAYDAHQFLSRPEPITDDELDSAYCLDELISIKTYDEIHDLLFATDSGSEEKGSSDNTDDSVEEPPAKEGKKKRRKREKKEKVALECPQGGTIGVDIEEFKECDDCPLYDECEEIADAE